MKYIYIYILLFMCVHYRYFQLKIYNKKYHYDVKKVVEPGYIQ